MKLFYSFAQFLISEWIWSFTFAFYHPLINILIMIMLLAWFAQQRIIPAVLCAVSSQLCAILLFAALVHLLLDITLGISFEGYEDMVMIHPLAACFLLGMIYAVLQIFFFYMLAFFYRLPLRQFSFMALLSNAISALIVFKFLPVL